MPGTTKTTFVAALTALWSIAAGAQEVTLNVPDEVPAGAKFKVTFTTERAGGATEMPAEINVDKETLVSLDDE